MSQYFYSKGNYRYGPVSVQQLREQKLSADDLVWKAGMPKWIPANQIEELHDLFYETPPPIQHGNVNNKKKVAKEVLLFQYIAGYSAIIAIFVTVICLFVFQPYKFDGAKYKEIQGITSASISDITTPIYSPLWWSEGFDEYCDNKVGFNSYSPQISYEQRKEYLIWKAIKLGLYTFLLCLGGSFAYRYMSKAQRWIIKNAD
ncbi:DUF4339 domain-containing protein [Chitinophagaceae bacterium LB-8]|uniref:DUF4339 domain-containing protein n=1 Tax=Paraflavisolibacter caeni TaxID=2982496 RepID=A0A9X2XY94_9BACT|nr:DUF4339 domain-containing protein [Paraflavisolibacter caeni]MCU7551794.1 DUF4339 domain-containing protein [Paraflavisolibacter caeni]